MTAASVRNKAKVVVSVAGWFWRRVLFAAVFPALAATVGVILMLQSSCTSDVSSPDYGDIEAFDRGNAALDEGRWDDALAAFREAIQKRPAYGPTYYGLGRAYFALRDYPAAKDALEKALEVEKTLETSQRRAMVYQVLSQTYFMLNHKERAKQLIFKALELDPNEPEIRKVYDMIVGAS